MVSKRAVHGLCVGVFLAGAVPCLDGQTTQNEKSMSRDAHPSLEVATIKPSDPSDQRHRSEVHGQRIVIENQTVKNMIQMSYGVQARQIVNAPSWIESERFDIQGLTNMEGQPSVPQFQEMVRKLLAERFGLKLHMEKREMARYSLIVTKGGPKMEPTKVAPDALPNEQGTGDKTSRSWRMENVSMTDLAQNLQGELDRPVVDETGLKGRYDFTLKWLRTDAAPATDSDGSLPGIFTALQEQVGLKVEPSKGEVDVLVIEQVEQPSQN